MILQEAAKSELPAASMKLIHSGKVLKDDDKIDSCNIKPNDFLVVMIAKVRELLNYYWNRVKLLLFYCFKNS